MAGRGGGPFGAWRSFGYFFLMWPEIALVHNALFAWALGFYTSPFWLRGSKAKEALGLGLGPSSEGPGPGALWPFGFPLWARGGLRLMDPSV